MAAVVGSDCFAHFGFEDFDVEGFDPAKPSRCPVRGCTTPLVPVPFQKGEKLYCPSHGIRLHAGTFVYWNGPERVQDAQLRNFRVQPDLAREIALKSSSKAEKHRLGYEMSEDALSWNVFAALAEARKLREVASFLIDREIGTEPDLYLWGERIDTAKGKRGRFEPLDNVRDMLERDIHRFKTEPDIILIIDSRLIVCIEAKFGSGNSLSYEAPTQPHAKPTARAALLSRYLANGVSEATKRLIQREAIGEHFHSQLFRNVVFASEMANGGADWRVVNLVSSTQMRPNPKSLKRYSFANPEAAVRCYLAPEHQARFTYRTWEALHSAVIKGSPDLRSVDQYMCSKSAHYQRAFELTESIANARFSSVGPLA